jgi:hypothetical protein
MTGGPLRRTRLAWIAAALAAACGGESADPVPGPLGQVYRPTGIAVHHLAGGDARVIAASSNADLRFDDETGGAVHSIDPGGAAITFGVNIPSFAGDLALLADLDPVSCDSRITGPLAVTATRGSNTLNAVSIDPSGGLSCHRCGVPLDVGAIGDPFAVAVACRGGGTFAYVGYLLAQGEGWVSEYDLGNGSIRSAFVGSGPTRSVTYDAEHDRLYVVGLATGTPTPLRFVELRDCVLGAAPSAGGCSVGEAVVPSPAENGLELRSMALGRSVAAGRRRAFLTGRLYSASAAAAAGGRVNDAGGVLVAADLVENALGGVDLENVVTLHDVGRGAQDVRVLPSRGPGRGDLVAALAVDDGSLSIYDDETQSVARFGRRDDLGGLPLLGQDPFGLAVDPVAAGTVARVYVGSFRDSFITPVEVRLDVGIDVPDAVSVVTTARFTGATP